MGAWLRNDVHRARAITEEAGGNLQPNMVLKMHDGTEASWQLEGTKLVRHNFSAEGTYLGHVVVLRHVRSWRWWTVQGWLNVELEIPTHIDPGKAAMLTDDQRLARKGTKTVNLCVSVRGRGGRSW
jgi:hypothetical protein